MNCTIPLLKINSDDCLGDSVGKINYNFLALDTTLCNLSSLMFGENSKFIYSDKNLKYVMARFNEWILADSYSTNLKNKYKTAYTTVNLLSSFWGNYQFSIQLPINAVNLTADDIYLLTPTLSSVTSENINRTANGILKNAAESELNVNYYPVSYPDFTVVNVCCLLYNLVPIIRESTNEKDPLIKAYYFPSESFNNTYRNLNVTYKRDTVYISTGVILRFFVKDKKWNYMGYILDQERSTAQPNYNTMAIVPPIGNGSKIISNSYNLVDNCSPIEANKWYSADTYIYANGLYSGTSGKLGTITLTFRTSDNKSIFYTYKASGYNATTNTGGTDVYLEFDGNTINAYEQYPISKTLVKSWIYPYKDVKGVNYKYTYDNKAIAFSVCAASSLLK